MIEPRRGEVSSPVLKYFIRRLRKLRRGEVSSPVLKYFIRRLRKLRRGEVSSPVLKCFINSEVHYMSTQKRNQILTTTFLVIGFVFLYNSLDNISSLPKVFSQIDVLLKGIAFIALSVAAILASISFQNKLHVLLSSLFGLVIGFSFLYLPTPSLLSGSAFHILFSSAIAFGMTTTAKRIAAAVSLVVVCLGIGFLYLTTFELLNQTTSELLNNSALYLIIPGMIVFALVYSKKVICERISIMLIALGLISLCQPFFIVFYQTGFQLLLGGLTGFIVVAHR